MSCTLQCRTEATDYSRTGVHNLGLRAHAAQTASVRSWLPALWMCVWRAMNGGAHMVDHLSSQFVSPCKFHELGEFCIASISDMRQRMAPLLGSRGVLLIRPPSSRDHVWLARGRCYARRCIRQCVQNGPGVVSRPHPEQARGWRGTVGVSCGCRLTARASGIVMVGVMSPPTRSTSRWPGGPIGQGIRTTC